MTNNIQVTNGTCQSDDISLMTGTPTTCTITHPKYSGSAQFLGQFTKNRRCDPSCKIRLELKLVEFHGLLLKEQFWNLIKSCNPRFAKTQNWDYTYNALQDWFHVYWCQHATNRTYTPATLKISLFLLSWHCFSKLGG